MANLRSNVGRQRDGIAPISISGRTIVAAGISEKMFAIAQRRLARLGGQVQLRHMDAEAMPNVPDASVAAYSMPLAMEICDRRRALEAAFRVLRPGGRLVILEASSTCPGACADDSVASTRVIGKDHGVFEDTYQVVEVLKGHLAGIDAARA